MRRIGYWLGVGLLIAGAAAGLGELFTQIWGDGSTLSLGSIWFSVHGNSLVGFQALVEKGLSPPLWTPLQFLLTLSAWWLLIPPGLVLALMCREPSR